MIYNSFNFLIIFPILFLLYYVIPAERQRLRNGYLLAVSYLLYANWKPAYVLILLGVTLVTYCGGRILSLEFRDKSLESVQRAQEFKRLRRKRLVWCFALLGFLPLLVFKYYNFINDNISVGIEMLGLRFALPGLNWAIPMGISFFTFQAVGYMLDVYYGRIKAEKDFLTYALFISFFPSVVAGPINKASLVIPQLKSMRPYFDYGKAVEGLKFLLWGMFMKVVVADRVALYVDTVFPYYMNYTGMTCFLASILYTIQIYADFAGYSLMAIGVGKTLGFELTENFRRPYFAVSVTDFWRRWHISLSTWLKDYVYIPMGGSRCSKIRNYWNIFVTFLVSGIWHGANWTFIVWGIWHGLFQIIEKAIGQQKCEYGTFGKTVKIIITFLLVNFAWIFFRTPTLGDAVGMIERIFDASLPMTIDMQSMHIFAMIVIGVVILFVKDLTDEICPERLKLYNNNNRIVRWSAYAMTMMLILLMGVFDAGQFIYANF